MKKTALALLIFAFLIPLVVGVRSVEVANANFALPRPSIVIVSPANYETYSTNSTLLLNVTIQKGGSRTKVEYSLDGKENITIAAFYMGEDEGYLSTASLPELSEGFHNITVYAKAFPDFGNDRSSSETSFFSIGVPFSSSFLTNVTDEPLSLLLPVMPVIGFTALVIIVDLGLLLYLIKRKQS